MTVVDAQAVSKQFLLKHNASAELKVRFLGLLHRHHRQSIEEFWALKNVTFQVEQGEGLALVGRNGSGKSTLLKLIAAIHRPSAGRLLVARHARICSMIELGIGFHPELTGRENVFLNAALHGLTTHQTDAIYEGVVSYSGLEHFIDVPIKNYSSGMHMRLGFAIAAKLEPDILLLDEIFAVGDADFQNRCVATLRGFMEKGKTIIFVSHAPGAVRTICRRTCVLEHGQLVFDGDVEDGLAFYDDLLTGISGGKLQSDTSKSSSASDANHSDVDGEDWRFEFMRMQGLEPHHRMLLVVPEAVNVRGKWSAFLPRGRFVRLGADFDVLMSEAATETFDFAFVDGVFPHMPFNRVARCIATVVRRLSPGGRFYATWYENPDPASFEPVIQSAGVTTYPDEEPYHYPYDLITAVCDAVGASVERVTDTILIISRRT